MKQSIGFAKNAVLIRVYQGLCPFNARTARAVVRKPGGN
jgi:hypothetical protein